MPFTPPPQDLAGAPSSPFTPPAHDVAAATAGTAPSQAAAEPAPGPFVPPALDKAGAVPSDGNFLSRTASAVVEGFRVPFEDGDLGLSEATKESLREFGLLPAKTAAPTPIGTFNDMLIVGGSAGLDLIAKSIEAPIQGAIEGIVQIARELGVGEGDAKRLNRDLQMLAITTAVATGGAPARGVSRTTRSVVDEAAPSASPMARTTIAEKADEALAATNRDALESARARVAPTVAETIKRERLSMGQKTIAHTLDQMAPAKFLDESLDKDAYTDLRLLAGLRGTVEAVLERGTFKRMENGSLEFDGGQSLRDALKPMGDTLDDGLLYFVGRRAGELQKRGIDTGFSPEEIAAMRGVGDRAPGVVQAFDNYQTFNKHLLDFAQSSGLLNEKTRAALAKAGTEYVPFYRAISEEAETVSSGRKRRTSVFKRIKGGDAPIRDVLDNMVRNTVAWTELSIKNNARVKVIELVERYGMNDVATKMKTVPSFARLADEKARDVLEAEGLLGKSGLVPVFSVGRKNLPDNVEVVFRNGEREFWEIHDPHMLNTLKATGGKDTPAWLKAVGFPSQVLRFGITHTPEFMLRNIIRDTQAAFTQAKSHFLPVIDSVKGVGRRLVEDDAYWELMLNGGGFATTYAGETGAGTQLRHFYKRHGINYDRVLDTPRRLANGMEKVFSSFEMGTRLEEFANLRKKGVPPRDAALAAREISTDFGMRGSHKVVQGLAYTIPFLNARAQSLYRLGRFTKEDPKKLALRGSLIAGAALALYSVNKEDPRYRSLPDWVRDQHFVLFTPGSDEPWLIPKGFEYGALFASVPERMAESWENQHGKAFADAMLRMAHDTFAVDIPQVAAPLLDQALNSKFSGAPIVPRDLEETLPHEQFRPWTNTMLVETARAMSEELGIEVSPMRVEALFTGYFGTLGLYVLDAADELTRGYQRNERPTKRLDEAPVIRAFFKNTPYRNTQQEADFYDLLTESRTVAATARKMMQEGRSPDIDPDTREAALYALRPTMDKFAKTAAALSRQMRLVFADPQLTAKQKRTKLDQIQADRNRMFAEFAAQVPDLEVEEVE